MLTDEDKEAIDRIAHQIPNWQDHLADYRERHPEEKPQQVMKKASFTRRMAIAKMVHSWLDPKLEAIMEEVLREEASEGKESK